MKKYVTPSITVIRMETVLLAGSNMQGNIDVDNGSVDNGETGSPGAARSPSYDPWNTWNE